MEPNNKSDDSDKDNDNKSSEKSSTFADDWAPAFDAVFGDKGSSAQSGS
jgi:hypothetical protein